MRSQFIHLTFHALCIGTSSIYFEGHQSQTLPDNGNKTILRMRYELKSRKFYIHFFKTTRSLREIFMGEERFEWCVCFL